MIEHIDAPRRDSGDSRKMRRAVIVVVLLLALVILMLFLFKSCSHDDTPDTPTPPDNAGVTVGTIEQEKVDIGDKDIQTLLNEQVAEGMFRIFISTHIDVDAEGNIAPLIQNAGRNNYYCWVEILDEHDNVVYETDIIPPGYKVEEDVMTPFPVKGKSECKAVFHLLEGTTKDSGEVNSIEVAVDLVQQ